MEDLKLDTYRRLKSILTDGDELSDQGSKNLNEILGIKEEKKSTLFDKILVLLGKIDSFIFKKSNKMWSNNPHKRKNG
jgi:hypothetical protein